MESSITGLAGKHIGPQSMTQEEMMEMAQETRRRRDATETGGASTLEDGGTCNRAFSDPSQKFVLVNVASTNQRPKSLKPAFRVMGFFGSQSDLEQHAAMVHQLDPSCTMRMWTSQEFYNISQDHDADPEQQMHKVNENLRLHQEQLNACTEEFVKHKEELTQGRTPVNMQADSVEDAEARIVKNKEVCSDVLALENGDVEGREGGSDHVLALEDGVAEGDGGVDVGEEETKDNPPTSTTLTTTNTEEWASQVKQAWPDSTPVPKAPRLAEIRNQNWISFMTVQDYQDGTEPGICILAGFDTEEDAHRYNKYVAAAKIDEHELHTHAMYEWVYPHLVASKEFDAVEQMYRNEEQDRIMRTLRKQQRDVANFEEHFNQRGLDVPTIEVEPDLLQPQVPTRQLPEGSMQQDVQPDNSFQEMPAPDRFTDNE
ncbi:MAG: hypothetical protein K0U52_02120 [Gammaproteobacteria bacterium]|nr:hypothetical protein [Gammaproteobacteria bacterium]